MCGHGSESKKVLRENSLTEDIRLTSLQADWPIPPITRSTAQKYHTRLSFTLRAYIFVQLFGTILLQQV